MVTYAAALPRKRGGGGMILVMRAGDVEADPLSRGWAVLIRPHVSPFMHDRQSTTALATPCELQNTVPPPPATHGLQAASFPGWPAVSPPSGLAVAIEEAVRSVGEAGPGRRTGFVAPLNSMRDSAGVLYHETGKVHLVVDLEEGMQSEPGDKYAAPDIPAAISPGEHY